MTIIFSVHNFLISQVIMVLFAAVTAFAASPEHIDVPPEKLGMKLHREPDHVFEPQKSSADESDGELQVVDPRTGQAMSYELKDGKWVPKKEKQRLSIPATPLKP